MELPTNYIFLLMAIIFSIHVSPSQCRQVVKRREKGKEREVSSERHISNNNICDITDRTSKVHCYCESTNSRNATWAECWVFNGGITRDDVIWKSFMTQPNMRELAFNVRADGGLAYIPTKAINLLHNLKKLTVNYATIEHLPPHAFGNTTTLAEIILTRSKVLTLAPHSFSRLMNLTSINLEENRITEINRDVFFDLPNLQQLTLSNNNLSVIHDKAFSHLTNLINLEVDRNSISVLTRDTFEGLGNLQKLNLRSNRLNMLGDLTFEELWNLHELFLDNNELQYISERAFDGLSQLRRLTLSDNKIEMFAEGLFEGVRGLVFLDFRRNRLQLLEEDQVKPIIDNLKHPDSVLFLEGNPLICDCRLSWIHTLRNETKSEQLQSALDQIDCFIYTQSNNRIDQVSQNRVPSGISYDRKNNVNTFEEEVTYNGPNPVEDVYDEMADEREDDEDAQRDSTQQENSAMSNLHQKLLQIPKDSLPCPRQLVGALDSSISPPTQNEVRYFGNLFSSANRSPISILGIAAFYCILLLL